MDFKFWEGGDRRKSRKRKITMGWWRLELSESVRENQREVNEKENYCEHHWKTQIKKGDDREEEEDWSVVRLIFRSENFLHKFSV